MISTVFGVRLRALRRDRGLTQEALASRSEVSIDAVRRLEGGRYSPTLDTLGKLSTGLGVSLHGLVNFVETEELDERQELDDYLGRCSAAQLRLALRVLRVIFEPVAGEAK